MKPAKGEKKKEKSNKKSKKSRKKFQTSSSSLENSSSSTTDKDEKRSSRASKQKAKKKLVVVHDDDDDDNDCESSEFEEDVPQTLDDSQPIPYTMKREKGSFLTRVTLKRDLRSSFEHGYVILDYQSKTFKTNLFQKALQTLTNCVQYFYKRPLKFVMVGTFYSLCITNRENFVHESRANHCSQMTFSEIRTNTAEKICTD